MEKVKVVITHATRWVYFQWFILGFYQLEKEGKIDFKIKVPFKDLLQSNRYTNRIGEKLHLFHEDSYNLYGYVLYPNNEKKYFCIDSADSPFLFHSDDLKKVDCYFKMQCPIDLDKKDFELTKDAHIPWLDHVHKKENGKYFVVTERGARRECESFFENRYKIKPLMIGPRRLSNGISYFALNRGYKHSIAPRNFKKEKKLMCYFGNAKGPDPRYVEFPDFDYDSNVMGYFKEKIQHPNEKRGKVAEIIASLGDDYDARIISQVFSYENKDKNLNLVVPLKDFSNFVSKFQYNFNVSGLRLSIPNRFIDSFMVGTGIVTDKLSVKWYLPFSKEEVKETVSMGYKRDEEVDWDKVKEDIIKLKTSNPEKIIADFEEKWAPKKVAEYMLSELDKEVIL